MPKIWWQLVWINCFRSIPVIFQAFLMFNRNLDLFAQYIQHNHGLLFSPASYLVCGALSGICSAGILSVWPNQWRICWTTLSSRIVCLSKDCHISSFFLFLLSWYSCNILSFSVVRIHCSSCFRLVNNTDPDGKMDCNIILHIPAYDTLYLFAPTSREVHPCIHASFHKCMHPSMHISVHIWGGA